MPRKPRDQLFKKSDVFRLIETARTKNLPIARIDVTRDGKLSLIVGEAKVDDKSSNNEVENWISQHEHQD